jgi:hypothetical protein
MIENRPTTRTAVSPSPLCHVGGVSGLEGPGNSRFPGGCVSKPHHHLHSTVPNGESDHSPEALQAQNPAATVLSFTADVNTTAELARWYLGNDGKWGLHI